ncbi:autophagy-related protein 8i-like [Salvia miltiorrhiza]|uniref:autophagy-related protein 8i-like n=1 Tax=Salvia miltiorrhiza TaxID=226208 RepID=UPI0025AD675C|nr:autophagy-related protein 8i-like [Salvia miltiorrhiza]XP_057790368.1 autophagy-related protein 8i-like [Salvia miltiorrhiza]
MGKMQSFKEQFSFDERAEESQDIIAKYPDRVPVVAERYSKSDLPEMEKRKFLVPRDMSVGQFIHILGARLRLTPGKALFVFVKDTLPQTTSLIESLYNSSKDEDGFLYMCYSSEKTFGSTHNVMWHELSLG